MAALAYRIPSLRGECLPSLSYRESWRTQRAREGCAKHQIVVRRCQPRYKHTRLFTFRQNTLANRVMHLKQEKGNDGFLVFSPALWKFVFSVSMPEKFLL
jgi:hypothetical protein